MRQAAVLEPSRGPFAMAAALAVIASLSLAAILRLPILSASAVPAIDDVGEGVAALIAAAACAWAARRSSGHTRLAWSLMAISAAALGRRRGGMELVRGRSRSGRAISVRR